MTPRNSAQWIVSILIALFFLLFVSPIWDLGLKILFHGSTTRMLVNALVLMLITRFLLLPRIV